MKITVPYGPATVTADLDWAACLGTLDVADAPELPCLEQAVADAIERPIGLAKNLYEAVAPGDTVAILVSDSFRETGARQFLPVLIDGLNRAGIPDEAMTIIFATGVHRPPTDAEQARILGEAIHARFQGRTHAHDPEDSTNLTYVGTTARGTRLAINKRARDCRRIIATGSVVMHYFAGFGGGPKAVLPGIASVEAISHNHAMNLDRREDRINPDVRIGALAGNPVAEDMLEGARLAGVDFLLNTVLNRQGRIAGVFAGDLEAAHRAAAEFARSMFAVPIREKADLVIASAGSAKNFVQSHKALYNAYQAVKREGRIVFLSPCEEGLGGERFAQWVRLRDRAAIMAGLRRQSEINGQTALSTLEKAPITLFVTEMTQEDVELLGGRKVQSLRDALRVAREDLGHVQRPSFYLMPSASYSVPFLSM